MQCDSQCFVAYAVLVFLLALPENAPPLMWKSALLRDGRHGFYVAVHPWLKAAGYIKVGYTSSLQRRLHMVSFKTCFTAEWYYYAVFECETPRDALLLEQSVLYCLREKRVLHRELLQVSEETVVSVARMLADRLKLHVTHRSFPVYESEITEDSDVTVSHEQLTEAVHAVVEDEERDTEQKRLRRTPPKEIILSVTPYLGILDEVRHQLSRPPSVETERIPGEDGDDDTELDGLDDLFEGITTYGATSPEAYSLTELRPYQAEAVTRVRQELEVSGQAICQMACRCGKTPVAYHLMRDCLFGDGNSRVLYLVPGLSLLRQTARKLFGYGLKEVPLLLVGSDPTPVDLGDDESSPVMTTDPVLIRERVLASQRIVVISTYHSSPLLESLNVFGLTVFDECHRVCGSCDKTAFNTILSLPRQGKRLFLTATPTYDTPLKMSNKQLFGGIAYRYYLREGIDAGFVNPFAVRIVLGGSFDDMNPYFYEAMRLVNKMLVFCRSIDHAEQLYAQLLRVPLPEDVTPFTVLIAHSKLGAGGVSGVLARFMAEKRCLLLNVRLFQEGVEIPDLNAVFFAAPRYSPRDIIQSICRPLNRCDGKPTSYVFLPAVFDARFREDHPINLRSFSTLIPFTDALMDEDPALFEYMIDPQKKSYDLNVVGLRSLRLTSERLHEFVLPAVRRGVRYRTQNTDRLHRAARMPWKYVFHEMRRIVLECNRYPKTNDAWVVGETSVSMNLFYRYVRRGYQLYLSGEQTYLETFQLRDLESLPYWAQYGLHGPYPWRECLATLEKHLRKHGAPPPLDVHKGGYVGLDATPFERLSGCLMHVNQCDAKDALRLAPEKQHDMDRLCGTYGLKWRKRRTSKGVVRRGEKTFITHAYNEFKRLLHDVDQLPVFRRYLDQHFPGYPTKHERMETLANLQSGRVPPRHNPSTSRGAKTPSCGRRRLPHNKTPTAVERRVMCRICRVHVKTQDWEAHLGSPLHQTALRQLNATPVQEFHF